MQPLLAPPRDTLTEATVVGLLRDAPALKVHVGAELLAQDLAVVEDISADVKAAGRVSRASYATLHGTGVLHLARELAWGSAIIRPYLVLADGLGSARWNLGAYYTATPKRRVGQSPPVYEVAIYDLLHRLTFPVGESFAVAAGANYLAAIESILTSLGFTAALVDRSAAAAVLPAAKGWPISEQANWLTIINELLGAVGYQGIWSDWDGRLRLSPYHVPRDRAAEWTYEADVARVMYRPEQQEISTDLFEAPNRWVAVRNNDVSGPAPVEGNGKYTFTNDDFGPASVAARGGGVFTRMLFLDAADQAGLVAQATISIAADMSVPTTVAVATSPNPQHWHFDRVDLAGHEVLGDARLLSTSWTLPLDGGAMSHEWLVL